jgi:Xaa-Pro dipeptidase
MKLTEQWYRNKTEEIQKMMARNKLEALLLLDNFNIYYASGFFHQSTERPLGMLIPKQGKPSLFVPKLEKEMAEDTWIDDIRVYFDFPGPKHPIIWMLEHIDTKFIGVDNLSVRDWNMVHRYFPTVQITDLVYTMRLVKDDEEVALLDKAGIYADYLVEKTKEAIIEGLNEIEAYNYARDATVNRMKSELDELIMPNLGLTNGAVLYGPHSAHPHGLMGYRKPQKGDVIEAGFGALVCTYESESEHTFMFGEPDKQTVDYFNAMYGAWEAGMKAAKPGVTCASVNEASLNVIREAGYEQYLRHRMGHGKGLEEHEAPWIEEGDFTILEPGMIISDEPGLYVPGLGGFRHSDTLLITEDGCRRLTNYPRDLESCIIR